MNRKQAHILIFCVSISLILAAPTPQTSAAFQGPPAGANPPTGGGLMGVDPNRNVQLFDIQAGSANATPVGALDGAAFGRVFMITANDNPGIGVKDIGADRGYIFTARNNGTLALWDDFARAVRFYVDQSGNIAIGSTDPALAKLHVFGNIRTESSFIGGRMQAAYLASDVFGDFTGGGNFAFPAALGIGVSSIGGLPANGLYVAGSVGIGATPPAWSKLSVNGDIALTSQGSWPGYVGITSEAAGVPMIIKARSGANPDLVVHTSGNIGIGTTNPSYKLDSGSNTTDELRMGRLRAGSWIGVDGSYMRIQNDALASTLGNHALRQGQSGNTQLNSASGQNLDLSIANIPKLTVHSGGNVGIGTASPGDKLTVANGAVNVTGDSCDDESNFKIKNGELVLQWSGGGNCGNPPSRMGLLLHNAELTNAVGLFPSGALDMANTTYAFQSAFAGYPANRIKMRSGDFSFGYKAASTIASFTEGDWQDRLFIEGGTGEVGIGTTNPTTKLHVAGDVKVEGDVIANNTGAATEISAANVSQGTFGSLSTKGNYKFEGALNTNPVFFIDATNEKVGIGTAGPTEKLEVAGNITITNGKFTISHNSDAIEQYFQDSADSDYFKWRFQRNADTLGLHSSGVPYPSYIMAITKTGNVGIGTTNPLVHLDLYKSGGAVQYIRDDTSGFKITTANDGINYIESAGAGMSGAADLRFTDMNAANTWMVIKSSGNVGIGTASPGALLHLSGAGTNGGFFALRSTTPATGSSGTGPNVFFRENSTERGWLGFLDLGVTGGAGTFNMQTYNGDIRFAAGSGTWDNYVMTIKNSGNVGIGTTDPTAKLTVLGGTANFTGIRVGGNTISVANNYAELLFTSRDNGGAPDYGSAIRHINTQGSPSYLNPRLAFFVQDANTNLLANMTEKMTILGSGNVGIGTANPLGVLQIKQASNINLLIKGAVETIGAISINAVNDLDSANVPLEIRSSKTTFTTGNVGIGNANPQHALDIQGAYYSRMVVRGNVSGAVTINWNEGNVQHITLVGNVALTFTNGQSGGRYVLVVKQDATGGRTLAWPTNSRFPGGATFNVTATAGRTDYMGFLYNGVDSKYDNVAFSAAFF